MIKQMIAKDKIAIVRFVPRQTSAVRFCALLPQQEHFDEDNFQTPPGFNLIFLPFADDIRNPDTVKPIRKVEVSRENVVTAKQMVKALTIDFDSRNFTNPNIQNFFTRLQAIALNEDEPEEVEDLLQPDEEGFKEYEPYIEGFKSSVWSNGYVEPTQTTTSRGRGRKKDDDEGAPTGRGAKGTKKEKVDVLSAADDYKPARGKKGGKRGKKGSDDEDDGADEYDMNDGFVVDDKPKSSRKKKMDIEEVGDDDITNQVETHLRAGEVSKTNI